MIVFGSRSFAPSTVSLSFSHKRGKMEGTKDCPGGRGSVVFDCREKIDGIERLRTRKNNNKRKQRFKLLLKKGA